MPVCAGPFEDGIAAYDQGRHEAAFRLWLPLAEQGHAAAQFNVAVMYEKGIGVAQDFAQAARWYRSAAERGDIESRYSIGAMYEAGQGVPQDADEARKWYLLVIADKRDDAASQDAKQRARARLARLPVPGEEIVAYAGGRFAIGPTQNGACAIALQGVVNMAAGETFDQVVARSTAAGCTRPWIVLESPGGGLFDGLRMGELVRERRFRTVTRYECSSACGFIFMGGVERVLVGSRARIGLHQATNIRPGERTCAGSIDSAGMDEIRRYMRYVIPKRPQDVVNMIIETPCDKMTFVAGQQAIDLGIATRVESEHEDLFGPPTRH